VKSRGTIRFYESEKEFGFITPDTGGSDIFFSRKAIIGSATPVPNDVVQFDVSKNRVGRVSASNVELVDE
jgi:cold shock protein